jgi:hypothetical protein
MAEYTCEDINGNEINQYVFGDDGIVYGLVNYDGSETSYGGTTIPYSGDGDLVNLTSECCSKMNFNFDSDNGKCYYREVKDGGADIKIVFNVEENNGVVFTKTESETCALQLKFDYLIEYDTSLIYDKYTNSNINVIDILNGLDLSLMIEKYGFRETSEGQVYESNKTLIPIVDTKLYGGITTYESTGVILSGDKVSIVNNKLKNELGALYNEQITNSQWLNTELLVNDPDLIEEITNEEVKFSIVVNENACDFSLIMDNIELNKICDKNYVERRTVDKSPSFNLVRVVDNKKSWVDKSTVREHDLPIRETKYGVDDERLVINSKEIELSTSISDAIGEDVVTYIQENPGILNGFNSSEEHTSIDLIDLLSTDISEINSSEKLKEVLLQELINVKGRKTSKGYPTLNMLYERYLNSELYTGGTSNKYTSSSVFEFVGLLGFHWIELIEQVIPSSTIWGSTTKVGSSMFHSNKFSYNKYNLFFCNKTGDTSIIESNDVEVQVTSLDGDDELSDKCNNIYVKRISDDCITIGSVRIVGNNQSGII